MSFTAIVVESFSVLTVVAHVVVLLIAVSYVRGLSFLRGFIERNVIAWMLAVAVLATGGSLFLSEIAGFTPCVLCWYQRIAMYPLVVVAGIALWKNDRHAGWYALPLCVIGGAIAAWHYGEHVWTAFHPADPTVPCGIEGVSCAKPAYWHLGYVTIPLMAFTAFVLEAVGATWLLRKRS